MQRTGQVRVRRLFYLFIGEPYHILKYDQVVHTIGFGATTMLMYDLLRRFLRHPLPGWIPVAIVIIMAGMGTGALNKVIEFLTVVLFPSTGVGGYYNTSLDLVFNMIGAGMTGVYVVHKAASSTGVA